MPPPSVGRSLAAAATGCSAPRFRRDFAGARAPHRYGAGMRLCLPVPAACLLALTGCFSDSPTITAGASAESSGGSDTSGGSVSSTSAAEESGTTAASATAETSTTDPDTTGVDSSSGGAESSGSSESTGSAESSGSSGTVAECGNGLVESPEEECDGADVDGQSCESLDLAPGPLGCTAMCTFDTSECVPPGMVLVPGGPFEMGSFFSPDEGPVRIVEVDPFYIDQHEVTVADFTSCVIAGACSEPDDFGDCNYGDPARQDHPINCVGWEAAQNYCQWVEERRLPTEAEWEKAARGVDARIYPWGNEPTPDCEYAVMNEGAGTGCGVGSTWEVGGRPLGASPYNALDMSGNVWEWVADWYAPMYDAADLDNPMGPPGGAERVLRGGGWFHAGFENFSTTYRHEIDADFNDQYIGFRCAQPLPGAP